MKSLRMKMDAALTINNRKKIKDSEGPLTKYRDSINVHLRDAKNRMVLRAV